MGEGGIEGGVSPPSHAGDGRGQCPLRSRAPQNIRANCAPVGVFLDSPSPTGAKEGGGRQATPAVNPFVYASLVSVVE